MNPHTQSNSSPVTPGACRGKWLVVDDDSLMRSVLASIVECETGAEVVECETGDTAWDAWINCGGIEGIVTDRDMPGMDGFELAARVHEQDRVIPIIVVTAHADDLAWVAPTATGVRQIL